MTHDFQIGDIVRRLKGVDAIRITEVEPTRVFGIYIHSGESTGRLHPYSIVKVNEENNQKRNSSMKGKLFKVMASSSYGVGLAVDSTGKYVLEMKDNSGVRSFDKNEVEVVMPFTFSARYGGDGPEYSYLGRKGTVSVGDLLLKKDDTKGASIAKVTAVDTKCDKATKYFDGVKLLTIPLEGD